MITNGSSTHLTLWTWNLHMIAQLRRVYIKDKTSVSFLVASFIGSYCVLFGYIAILIMNPKLEYSLAPDKNSLNIWLRSGILHLLPCIVSTQSVLNKIPKSKYVYLYYLCVPIFHLVIGAITSNPNFDAFKIYVDIPNIEHSNKYNISKSLFIIISTVIMLLTVCTFGSLHSKRLTNTLGNLKRRLKKKQQL